MIDSLDEDEFRKLFPSFDVTQFMIDKNNKVYYAGDGLDLSLYSYEFWRARRKVVSLNLSEKGMEIWRQDKQNFLKNWRHFVESHPDAPRGEKVGFDFVEWYIYWSFKEQGKTRKEAEEFIRKNVTPEYRKRLYLIIFSRITTIILVIYAIRYAIH